MKHSSTRRPEPTKLPRLLPPGLLVRLLRRGRIVLLLDYDGTVSAITPRPFEARPLPRVHALVRRLATYRTRLTLGFISGRQVSEVKRLLGVEGGILFAGTHGMELVDVEGRRHLAPGVEDCLPELKRTRTLIRRLVRSTDGFVVEDKKIALALHYRLAEPRAADLVRSRLRGFIESRTPGLRILHGNMVDEVIPREAWDKGSAVSCILGSQGVARSQAAYFGDDVTDEDAFAALEPDGISVLVGPRRPSRAVYRVQNPEHVVDQLARLVAELDRECAEPPRGRRR